MNFQRLREHKKNERLEELLKEVNAILGPAELAAIASFKSNKHPIILIVGNPRSGTTIMLQWLASLGYFSYPTNLLSRFYGAPYIGAKIQLMLTKYDFNNELFDFNEEVPFVSNLGKTKGVLAPNEFWYFWRRFFRYGEIQYLNDEELKTIDCNNFISELAAIESVFDKPFVMKGMIINWNIPFISSIFEKVLFIYMRRHPFYNIQSLIKARKKYYGDIRAWYSFKPPEYIFLKNRSPYEQVAGQIYYTGSAINDGLKKVHESRYLTVNYEDLCEGPENIFNRITDKLDIHGVRNKWEYTGPKSFKHTNRVCLSDEERENVIRAYENISGETINL